MALLTLVVFGVMYVSAGSGWQPTRDDSWGARADAYHTYAVLAARAGQEYAADGE